MCKEWLNLIRYDSILSGNLIITMNKEAKDINKFLQSFPMLEAIVFKIPHHDAEASLEFIKGLNFDSCPGLEKVSAILLCSVSNMLNLVDISYSFC